MGPGRNIDEREERDEGPQACDLEAFGDDADETPTKPCPACGADIYDDAERCDRCGEWITPTRRTHRGRWWFLLAAALALLAALAWSLMLWG